MRCLADHARCPADHVGAGEGVGEVTRVGVTHRHRCWGPGESTGGERTRRSASCRGAERGSRGRAALLLLEALAEALLHPLGEGAPAAGLLATAGTWSTALAVSVGAVPNRCDGHHDSE